MFFSLFLDALLAGTVASAAVLPARDQSCNGSPELCDRLYSNVTFVGAHDSAFVGTFVTDNQYLSVADQLGLGVRFLQAQTHNKLGTIELCHTSCLEKDAGTLTDYLTSVKTFLDDNADEVVTLLLTNGDDIAVSDFGAVFADVGLDAYGFQPSGTLALDEWPTLASLIASGTRLVVFMDYHADTSVVPYILDEFSYFFETPYDTTDPNFAQCTIDRPSGASAAGRLALVNHFLDVDLKVLGFDILIPDAAAANTTNSVSSILAQTDLCLAAYGSQVNVVLLDFINVGEAMEAQSQLNGL